VGNSLTVILGWIEEARQKAGDERQALELGLARAKRAVHVCRAAIGAEPAQAPAEGLADLLGELRATLAKEVGRRGATLEVELAAELEAAWVVRGSELLSILENLVLNALEAGAAVAPRALQLRVGVTSAGPRMISLHVSDNGPGVREELRSKLFTAGFTTKRAGAGIGLAHGRAVALSVGGSLDLLLTTHTAGATFELCWPHAARNQPFEATPHTMRRRDLTGVRIALIEDDPSVIELLEMVLAARGAEVQSFADHARFQVALCEGPFDVALLDASPFGASLESSLQQLRGQHPQMDLVLISGASDPGATLGKLGVTWIRKPFDVEEVVFVVQTLKR
jgi:CheY-like chemotaxis protein